MNQRLPVLTGLVAIAIITLVAIFDIGRPSPGPLIPTHARIDGLQGTQGCVQCHGADGKDLAGSCLECHTTIADQVDLGLGIHGGLSASETAQCGLCHPEHLDGINDSLVAFSFAQADLARIEDFRHESVEFHLDGRHDSLACIDCHSDADTEVLEEGAPRFQSLTQDCIQCHDDPHEGAMQRSCQACHGQEHAFDDLHAFPHAPEIPLHGSHADLDCNACHEPSTPTSMEALSDVALDIPWRTCAECHGSPHSETFLSALPRPAAAAEVGKDACVLCHSEQHQDFHGKDVVWRDPWHTASGFALEEPHQDLTCNACHGERLSLDDFQERYPGRAEQDCAACHADPHEGQFDRAPYLEQGCLSCHAPHTFQPQDFQLERHNLESFPLEGRHAEAACNTCHTLADQQHPQSWVFQGTATRCEDCHADAHDQAFAPLESTLPQLEAGSCARCHDATGFQELTAPFDHDTWTEFPLTHGHGDLDCTACHARSTLPDATGRTLGKVAELFPGDPATCQGCHEDVHQGSFDRDFLEQGALDGTGCARCHGTTSFTDLNAGSFDHARWTAFPLDGAHGQLDCLSCHDRSAPDGALGLARDRFPGKDWSCATCHTDPHGGDFQRPNQRQQVFDRHGCARCHSTTSFKHLIPGAFDHGTWTGFDLVGAHEQANCSSCHQRQEQPDASGRRMARAAGGRCIDCHIDIHAGQFMQDGNQDCLSCHDTAITHFAIPEFDHDRLTAFPLDETHGALDCAACHQPISVQDWGDVIRYRPLGNSCVDCHGLDQGGLDD